MPRAKVAKRIVAKPVQGKVHEGQPDMDPIDGVAYDVPGGRDWPDWGKALILLAKDHLPHRDALELLVTKPRDNGTQGQINVWEYGVARRFNAGGFDVAYGDSGFEIYPAGTKCAFDCCAEDEWRGPNADGTATG